MTIIERIEGLTVTIGGEEHSGWLPEGAATPEPTPEREVMIDLRIIRADGGLLLECRSRDGLVEADTWHPSVDDAREHARRMFGVEPATWRRVDGDT